MKYKLKKEEAEEVPKRPLCGLNAIWGKLLIKKCNYTSFISLNVMNELDLSLFYTSNNICVASVLEMSLWCAL